jgi:ABC-2 type transport system ATP-binding protein
MHEAIEVRALRKRFGDVTALDGLDLHIEAGTVFGLLGPNGAGKTTLVRILATLLQPTSGRATVLGHDVVGEPLAVRRRIGLAGQFAAVDEELTGRENLELIGRLRRLGRADARQRANELLERFGLLDPADRRVSTYSGGMRRRLDLAMALIHAPEVLFLDEPTTGLDPVSRITLWEEVRRLRDEGTTVFLTTQYLEEADQLADRVGIINAGLIVAEGTPRELKAEVGRPHLDLTLSDGADLDRAREVLASFGDPRPPAEGCHLSVTVAGGAAEIAPVVRALDDAGFMVASLELVQPTLDDVFVEKTGRHLEGAEKAPAAADPVAEPVA